MTIYKLSVPVPCGWINANHRNHWSEQARKVRTWRAAAYTAARAARLPKGLQRVRIDAVLRFRTNRRRDAPNFHPTLKAVVDGLTASKRPGVPGYGLIPDDTPEHLEGPFVSIGPVMPARSLYAPVGGLYLTITDLTEEVSLVGRMRTVKPETFRSRSLARCPIEARYTFIGLWTEADDHGRGVADPRILKGVFYPLDDSCTFLHVSAHLDVLAATGHIRLYEVEGETYYEIVKWTKHQAASYRRGEPKYPDPSAGHELVPSSAREVVQESASRTNESAGTGNREQGREQGTGIPASPPEDAPPADGLFDVEQKSTDVAVVEEVKAGHIVKDWIDYCTAHDVKLTKRIIGQYAKGIGEAMDEGFAPELIKTALASMLADNVTDKPSYLSNRIVAAQTGPERRRTVVRSTTDDRVNGWQALAATLGGAA